MLILIFSLRLLRVGTNLSDSKEVFFFFLIWGEKLQIETSLRVPSSSPPGAAGLRGTNSLRFLIHAYTSDTSKLWAALECILTYLRANLTLAGAKMEAANRAKKEIPKVKVIVYLSEQGDKF